MGRIGGLVRDPLVVAVAIAGVVVTALACVSVDQMNRTAADRWLEERGITVSAETEQAVVDTIDDLTAIAAFVELSGDLTADRFDAFVRATEPGLGFIGVAYVAVVPAAERAEFIAQMRAADPDYALRSLTGVALPAADDGPSFPVVHYSMGPLAAGLPPGRYPSAAETIGVDVAAEPSLSEAVTRSLSTRGPTVSEFIEVPASGLDGRLAVVYVPILDDDGEISGFVAAPMIERLLTPHLLVSPLAREVSWAIDVPGAIPPEDFEHRSTVDVAATRWEVVVTPRATGHAATGGVPVWVVVGVGGAFTLLLMAMVYLARQRSHARRRADQLERLAAEKDRFLATVSHELRTPLTTVSGLAFELHTRYEDFDPAEVREFLGLVVEEAGEMADIVEDLLVAARSDIGRIALDPLDVDLAGEAEHAALGAGAAISVEGIRIGAHADPQRLRQVIRNLVTNAGRYGGPTIRIVTRAEGDEACLEVLDDGPPIPPDRRERMFDPYTSAVDESSVLGSIGLGLFISRTLARLMGGDLTYRHDGRWSRFELRLPAASPPPPRPPEGPLDAGCRRDRTTTPAAAPAER